MGFLTATMSGLILFSLASISFGAGFRPYLTVGAGRVGGVIVFPDGAPAAGLPVRLWDVDKEQTLYRTLTNVDGVFDIPGLKPGRMQILVGRMKVDLQVVDSSLVGGPFRNDLVLAVSPAAVLSIQFDPGTMVFNGAALGAFSLMLPELLSPSPGPSVMSP